MPILTEPEGHAVPSPDLSGIRAKLVTTAVLATLLLTPAGVAAQRLPGMPGGQGGTVAMHQAEFYAHVMTEVRGALDGWHRAWAEDEADELASHYADDAVVAFPGRRPVWGRAAISEALTDRLGTTGEAQVAIGDVSASGRVAYVGGRFQIELEEGDSTGEQIEGFHSTVFYRTGRDWLIRSQVFHPDPEVDEGGSRP